MAPKKTKPNQKQKLFVERLMVPGANQTKAYLEVYGGNPDTADSKASQLVAKPHIQEHIRQVVERKFPDLSDDCASTLASMIKDPETGPNIKLKAIDLLAKYMGWHAPTRAEHLHAKLDMSKFKLPGSDK